MSEDVHSPQQEHPEDQQDPVRDPALERLLCHKVQNVQPRRADLFAVSLKEIQSLESPVAGEERPDGSKLHPSTPPNTTLDSSGRRRMRATHLRLQIFAGGAGLLGLAALFAMFMILLPQIRGRSRVSHAISSATVTQGSHGSPVPVPDGAANGARSGVAVMESSIPAADESAIPIRSLGRSLAGQAVSPSLPPAPMAVAESIPEQSVRNRGASVASSDAMPSTGAVDGTDPGGNTAAVESLAPSTQRKTNSSVETEIGAARFKSIQVPQLQSGEAIEPIAPSPARVEGTFRVASRRHTTSLFTPGVTTGTAARMTTTSAPMRSSTTPPLTLNRLTP
jgi:hypothetical protein